MAVNRLVHSHAPSTCAGYHEQSRAGKSKRWMSTSSRKYSRNLKAAPYANICVGSQMWEWSFGLSQMHTFVIVVIHLWKSQMWKWWFGLSQMHTFVIFTIHLWKSQMDHKCESGGLASAKRTLLWFCGQAEFGLYNTKGITQLGHKHKWMGLWL